MQIPNLPTDNLYKFLALSGLVIVLLGIGYPMSRMSDVKQKIIDLTAELKLFNLEAKRIKTEMFRHSTEISRLERKGSLLESDKHPLRGEVTEARSNLNELKAKHDAVGVETHALGVKQIQLEAKKETVNYLVSELRYLVNSMFSGVLIGGLLMWLGFTLWYRRVQKPLDLLLEQQVNQLTLKPAVEKDECGSS